jgi:hypothetical protein
MPDEPLNSEHRRRLAWEADWVSCVTCRKRFLDRPAYCPECGRNTPWWVTAVVAVHAVVLLVGLLRRW